MAPLKKKRYSSRSISPDDSFILIQSWKAKRILCLSKRLRHVKRYTFKMWHLMIVAILSYCAEFDLASLMDNKNMLRYQSRENWYIGLIL